jgi:hypothetical protein
MRSQPALAAAHEQRRRFPRRHLHDHRPRHRHRDWPGGTDAHAALPWTAGSRIPLGADGINLTVQLDAHGGEATCAISIDGRRLVSSLAQGAYSRATCHTPTGAQGDD